MILDRTAFLAVDDVEYGYVEIPEAMKLGDTEVPTIRVRSLDGDQRSRLFTRADIDDKLNAPNGYWRALCCAMGMVDDKGAYLFPNDSAGALLIAKRHPEIIERIATKILDMSSMTKTSRSIAEKKLLEATTNSGGTSSPEQSIPGTDSTLTDSNEAQEAKS